MFGRDEPKAAITYGAIIVAAAREHVSTVSVNSTLSLHIWKCIINPLKPANSLRKDSLHRKWKTNPYENAINNSRFRLNKK